MADPEFPGGDEPSLPPSHRPTLNPLDFAGHTIHKSEMPRGGYIPVTPAPP